MWAGYQHLGLATDDSLYAPLSLFEWREIAPKGMTIAMCLTNTHCMHIFVNGLGHRGDTVKGNTQVAAAGMLRTCLKDIQERKTPAG